MDSDEFEETYGSFDVTDADLEALADTLLYRAHALGALFTDILAQVCHFEYFGEFPKRKLILLPEFDWINLGEVEGFAVIDKDLVEI